MTDITGRIWYPVDDEDCPAGHPVVSGRLSARVDVEREGVRLDLHLHSEDTESTAPCLYSYSSLSSTEWGHKGVMVATRARPLPFAELAGREFVVDADPARPDLTAESTSSDLYHYGFGAYVQGAGHMSLARSRIRFTHRPDGSYDLAWEGTIGDYRGAGAWEEDPFRATASGLTLDHLSGSDPDDDAAAVYALLRAAMPDADEYFVPAVVDGALRFNRRS